MSRSHAQIAEEEAARMSDKNEPGRPTRQMTPDADLVKMFAVGCGILFVLFLCGWATIALFWMG